MQAGFALSDEGQARPTIQFTNGHSLALNGGKVAYVTITDILQNVRASEKEFDLIATRIQMGTNPVGFGMNIRRTCDRALLGISCACVKEVETNMKIEALLFPQRLVVRTNPFVRIVQANCVFGVGSD